MSCILFLFPDTNLFIQCRPLAELDWSQWQAFDEVHLIVSRPVQREIDYRKNKGNDRAGSRARATNSLFRDLLRSGKDHILIRETNPAVKLYIKPEYGHNLALADRLDYAERDDQLIGTVSTFLEQHVGADARLLTDDGTPMATAKSLGIAVAEIPASWLLPPESTESEKKVGALEAEVSRLKRAEPQFEIRCLNDQGEDVEKIEIELERYDPLTDDQVSAFIDRLAGWYPLATDFGFREASERVPNDIGRRMFGAKEVFVPATNEEIETYRKEKYPAWLKSCKVVLRGCHDQLNGGSIVPFSFLAVNEGTRPGKDVLVTIEAKGNFEIRPPPTRKNDDEDDDEDNQAEASEGSRTKTIVLPRPPEPPYGRWKTVSLHGATDAVAFMHRSIDQLINPHRLGMLDRHLLSPMLPHIRERDPNAFYYKPNRPMSPQSSFSLECAQWRHGDNEEWFSGEIHFSQQESKIAGVLECRIHAENLSEAAVKRVPVRINISTMSALQRAEEIVAALEPLFGLKLKPSA